MDSYEKEFNESLAKVKAFENDLKQVFEKHNVKLENDVNVWHGGSKDIIKIIIDSKHWINYDFDEVLMNIKVIN
jgi:hypothetical protein